MIRPVGTKALRIPNPLWLLLYSTRRLAHSFCIEVQTCVANTIFIVLIVAFTMQASLHHWVSRVL